MHLPSLKSETKLPVILNREELKQLFAVPALLKQRIVLALIYSAGLRGQEVINLKIHVTDFQIIKITDTHVTFKTKDYRDGARYKRVTLTGVEFLRQFCLYVMPERFVRIRRFGIYNHTTKRKQDLRFFTEAQQATRNVEKRTESRKERIRRLTGIDVCKCPSCKTGSLFITRSIPRIRSPAGNLPDILLSKLL